jgi:hypothetical protein
MMDNSRKWDGEDNKDNTTAKSQDDFSEGPTPVPLPPGVHEGQAPVGAITSPSETNRYRMVLRDYAATLQIEGSLVALDYTEWDSERNPVMKTVLCQASHMRLQNVHHEKPILGALLRRKGNIPGLSGSADNKEVDLLPMDTILVDDLQVHQLPRNIPSTGTEVRFASVQDVRNFSGEHQTLFNIGYLYETKVPIGLMLKHFGKGDDGWGDAHMLGIFGVTGSGKTVMAGSIIAGFAARHEMGMLIVDPQGQISGFELGGDKWSWQLDEAFRLVGRGPDVQLVKIEDIALESPSLFAHLLEKYDFFDALNILGAEKKEQTVRELTLILSEWLRENNGLTLGDLSWDENIAQQICSVGAATYADPIKQAKKMFDAFRAVPYKLQKAKREWERVQAMFSRPYKLGDLLDDVLIKRKIIVLNVEADEDVKDLYCGEILDGIKKKADLIYRIKMGQFRRGDPAGKYKNVQTNALIIIDEAHRFAPQTAASNKELDKMARTLTDAIKTTRKLGVGWCYVTQSIASFNKEIFRQIQTKILGVGIGTGADNDHLESAFNNDKDLIERYRNLPRPITTNVFPYAIIGELVALGNGSRALFISAFKDQQMLFDLNPKHFKNPHGKPVEKSPTMSSSNQQLISSRPSLPPAEEDDIPF